MAPPLPGGCECGWERGLGGEGLGWGSSPSRMTLTEPWQDPAGWGRPARIVVGSFRTQARSGRPRRFKLD
jgi:hypothetical protein